MHDGSQKVTEPERELLEKIVSKTALRLETHLGSFAKNYYEN